MPRTLPLFLVIALALTACTAPPPAPTATPTLPPATFTPLPSATATAEPTKAPGEVADSLGLRSEPLYQDRTFGTREMNGQTYLVDEYNGAPKAVLENGQWRELDYNNKEDAEIMYGALVPEGGGVHRPQYGCLQFWP